MTWARRLTHRFPDGRVLLLVAFALAALIFARQPAVIAPRLAVPRPDAAEPPEVAAVEPSAGAAGAPAQPPAEARVARRREARPLDPEMELKLADADRARGALRQAIRRYRQVGRSGAEPWAQLAVAALADLAHANPEAHLDERALLKQLALGYPSDTLGKLARERLDAMP